MLKSGDCVGIVACSNGLDESYKIQIKRIEEVLETFDLNVICSSKLYKEVSIFNGSNEEKAQELMKMFRNEKVKAIFDISGGDLANGVLDYLDFVEINNKYKPFFGYSDLSVVINSIYTKTHKPAYLYQIRNLIYENKEEQIQNFKNTLMSNGNSLFDFKYEWIQGDNIHGTVIGGNIRCFLKLAGTEYMPQFEDKVLIIEGLNGDVAKMQTFLNQLKQLKVFEKVNGIILGTFTEMESKEYSPTIVELVQNIVGTSMPIIKTNEIGHGKDSKCIVIGKKINLVR